MNTAYKHTHTRDRADKLIRRLRSEEIGYRDESAALEALMCAVANLDEAMTRMPAGGDLMGWADGHGGHMVRALYATLDAIATICNRVDAALLADEREAEADDRDEQARRTIEINAEVR